MEFGLIFLGGHNQNVVFRSANIISLGVKDMEKDRS
jgi:hypothetical protein